MEQNLDCVYIIRRGGSEELRYSIRSVEMNMPHRNIWVVGYRPDWYIGNFWMCRDTATKFKNLNNAMLAICDNPNITENFILMNDDFFVINKIDNVETFHGGSLKPKVEEYKELSPGMYYRYLADTYLMLTRRGVSDPIDYELHMPMIFNKTILKEILLKDMGGFPRSVYGNLAKIGGTKARDVKVYPEESELYSRSYTIDRSFPYVSTDDGSFEKVRQELLAEMFQTKSPNER
jgi:hypothetical protein